ncbi:MAG: TonB-dependent receptor [Cytophagaceae bacterium]|nr:TonB-dependent receptor [Cytophagaceae bacterium]MDW8455675.1 TonB-dependent receptor [Cytophagaceae bacterium]
MKDIFIYDSKATASYTGTHATVWNADKTTYRDAKLSDVLQQHSTAFVKTYGPGSLSTTSIRGGSAAHTGWVWNGIPIQSPMNGTMDMALIPMGFWDEVRLQTGGCSAIWGSGIVSSAIHLNNKYSYNNGIKLTSQTRYGSFANLYQQASMLLSYSKTIFSIKSFYQSAENNFLYTNPYLFGKPQLRLTNSALKLYGTYTDVFRKLNPYNELNLRMWHQYSYRQIPPLMTQNSSKASQTDQFIRLSTEWKRKKKKHTTILRNALFFEKLFYNDIAISLHALSSTNTWIADVENIYHPHHSHQLIYGIQNIYSRAKADNYNNIPQQNRSAMYASYNHTTSNKKLRSSANLRLETVINNSSERVAVLPLVPSWGAEYHVAKKMMLAASVNRVYRMPTFNDLYWIPGGNPSLKPEQGWAQEISARFSSAPSCHSDSCKAIKYFMLTSTAFNRTIHDWIIWLPASTIWMPQNVMKVWSRGVEFKSNINIPWRKGSFSASSGYDYIVSTNEQVYEGYESELHKQLIYVPWNKTFTELTIRYSQFSLSYSFSYTGYRFTTADNEQYLPPFDLHNAEAEYCVVAGKNKFILVFSVNNIFDEQYQVIAYRAMPGRNYSITIAWQYHKKNNVKPNLNNT